MIGEFLYCHGLGLLTDFNLFSQGYQPVIFHVGRPLDWSTESVGQ